MRQEANLKLEELSLTEMQQIMGGDKFTHDLGYAFGYIAKQLKNFWSYSPGYA